MPNKYIPVVRMAEKKVSAPAPIVSTYHAKFSTKNEATFEFSTPCKLHKLDKGPQNAISITAKDALHLYEQMVLIRRLENASDRLYKEKAVRGFCHLYTGQEAVAVGMHSEFREKDSLIAGYRIHGWTYLMGISIDGVLGELLGRRSGCSRGKGGAFHVYGRNFYGGNGIIGAQTAMGPGIAFAHKYRGDGGVCFTLYGDGAANQGQLFEGYNIAKLWNLPCIFVCENNGYGMGTSAARSSASTTYYTRGHYIPGIWVDGMDVLATKKATRFAIEYCASGKGPLVMEFATYRFVGHSMSDPGTSYRTRDEVKKMRQTKDPITNFKKTLLSSELATPEQLKEIETKVRRTMKEAVKAAKAEPEVSTDELTGDLYYRNYEPHIRGLAPNTPLPHLEVAKRTLK